MFLTAARPQLQSVADVASILHDLCTQAKQACGASGPLRALVRSDASALPYSMGVGLTASPPHDVVRAQGMCMSGFESKHKQVELLALLRGYGDVAEELMVYNDAVGSAFTASSNGESRLLDAMVRGGLTAAGDAGSVVVICGTGSIAQLVMADASTHRCGGWGHMVSDGARGSLQTCACARRSCRGRRGQRVLRGAARPEAHLPHAGWAQ